eukprot:scaffold952_cov249-Pinguiococcus_pyrenoidosus.AAC.4
MCARRGARRLGSGASCLSMPWWLWMKCDPSSSPAVGLTAILCCQGVLKHRAFPLRPLASRRAVGGLCILHPEAPVIRITEVEFVALKVPDGHGCGNLTVEGHKSDEMPVGAGQPKGLEAREGPKNVCELPLGHAGRTTWELLRRYLEAPTGTGPAAEKLPALRLSWYAERYPTSLPRLRGGNGSDPVGEGPRTPSSLPLFPQERSLASSESSSMESVVRCRLRPWSFRADAGAPVFAKAMETRRVSPLAPSILRISVVAELDKGHQVPLTSPPQAAGQEAPRRTEEVLQVVKDGALRHVAHIQRGGGHWRGPGDGATPLRTALPVERALSQRRGPLFG